MTCTWKIEPTFPLQELLGSTNESKAPLPFVVTWYSKSISTNQQAYPDPRPLFLFVIVLSLTID